jgi:hypothetical protein
MLSRSLRNSIVNEVRSDVPQMQSIFQRLKAAHVFGCRRFSRRSKPDYFVILSGSSIRAARHAGPRNLFCVFKNALVTIAEYEK